MKSEKIYNTISEFFKAIHLTIDQDFDFTIHSLHGLHGEPPMSSPYFRTNYHVFILFETGKGHYTIDEHWFPLKPFSYYFTNPGHLKSFTIEEEQTGYMLTFSNSFLNENHPATMELDFPFLFDEPVPVMHLTQFAFFRLRDICDIMIKEYQGNSPFKKKIIANQLISLLFQTRELLQTFKYKIQPINRPAEIAKLFRAALTRNFLDYLKNKGSSLWNTQDYANHLHVHPNYLSNIIKSETGKTVKQWIDEKIISEAKSMLRNTSMTISEVAHSLSFDDVSNFNRFFKSNTGQLPTHYRKS